MSSNLDYKQAANVERRTWDKESYEAKAKARIKAESGSSSKTKVPIISDNDNNKIGNKRSLVASMINDDLDINKEEFQHADKDRAGPMNSKRAFLKARTSKIDLESKVGTSEIVNPEGGVSSGKQITDGVTNTASGVGWHCSVCDCFLKDSLAYLDHINGKKHQRALGYSMRTEKSTTEDVSSRLQLLVEAKNKKEEEEEQKAVEMFGENGNDEEEKMNEFEKIVQQKDDEIANRKKDRAKRREERRKKAQQEKMKKLVIDVGGDDEVGEEEEDEDDDDQSEMAKLMGFSSFGA